MLIHFNGRQGKRGIGKWRGRGRGIAVALLAFATSSAYCASVNLAWDAVNDPNVGGYHVWQRTPGGTYSTSFDAGKTTQYTVPNLTDGATYQFVVTAYPADPAKGKESGYSNEVSYTVPGGTVPPLPPPLIPVSISTVTLPGAVVGTAYRQQLAAAGGTAPYVFSVTGAVPGLTLSSAGLLSGTPTAAGTYALTVSVKDSATGASLQSVCRNLSFAVTGTSPPQPPAYTCPCSIWASTVVPGTPADSDNSAVELGVKFKSSVSGKVTGIRFYKGSGNVGTHVATLWSATGTRLASATFGTETATGWQTVSFSTPVAITANTTYVASYYAPAGHYAFDNNLGSDLVKAPLTALARGVYKYGSSGFPTSVWQNSNYYVDVVFSTQ